MHDEPLTVRRMPRLLNALREQLLDSKDAQRLAALLRTDPQARRVYIEHIWLWAALELESQVAPAPIRPRLPLATFGGRLTRSMGFWASLAAAVVVIAATATFFLSPKITPSSITDTSRPAVALLTNTENAVFANGFESAPLGSELPAGPIQLTAGKAQIMFASTAVVDLTGPCEFEMTEPNRGRLTSGKLKAYVPQRARGFTVDLPHGARVVDLGTRFEVAIVSPSVSRVLVLEGAVEVQPARGQAQTLRANQQASLVGGVVEQAAALKPKRLTPDADAYVRKEKSWPNKGEFPALAVKNAEAAGATCKSYIRFDVSSLSDAAGDAELQLQVSLNNSGGGSKSAPNVLHFNVFGLHDGHAGENWIEGDGGTDNRPPGEITWANAPANDTAGNDIDTAQATLLGTFEVPALNAATNAVIIKFASEALNDFVRADTDGRITFILTRVEPHGSWNSALHSRESTTGQAPTLIVHDTP